MKPVRSRIDTLIEETINKSLKIDFGKITATQNSENTTPITHIGPGSITQHQDGYFQIEIHVTALPIGNYYEITTSDSLTQGLAPGTIIPKEFYFNIFGDSYEDVHWEVEDGWINSTHNLTKDNGLITSQSKKITATMPNHANKNIYIYTLAHEEFRFPCNEFTENEKGKLRNKSSFSIREASVEIKIYESTCQISITTKEQHEDHFYEGIVLAIQIVTGNQLATISKLMVEPGKTRLELHAQEADRRLWRVPPAMRAISPLSLPSVCNAVDAISKLYKADSIQHHFQYFQDLTVAYSSGIEAAALAASISVEGMAAKYYPHLSVPDPEFVSDCMSSMHLIKDLFNQGKISARVKGKLVAALKSSKSRSPKNTLYTLFDSGLVDSWAKIRHPAAHGTLLDADLEISELVKCTYTSIFLFYAMFLSYSGFDGEIVDYSSPGYPEILNPIKRI